MCVCVLDGGLNTQGGAQVWVVLIKVDSYWETHIELRRRRRSTIRFFTHESGMFPFICFAPQRSKVKGRDTSQPG